MGDEAPRAGLQERLRRDVEVLCPPRGRSIGSPEHDGARAFIVQRLRDLGVQPYDGVYEHPYAHDGHVMTNIAGVVRGGSSRGRPLLIGAHYDSVIPAPCADDNAAAVAIALAAAETLLAEPAERDVIIAIFDAEEPPHFLTEGMGSVRLYEDYLADHGVEAAIIMDLVGHDVIVPESFVRDVGWLATFAGLLPRQNGCDIAFPRLKDMLFITGAESHAGLPDVVDGARLPRGLRVLPTLNRYIGDMSDHAVFRRRGVPYLFLSCGRWPYYHTEDDTPEKLNYRKMARITRYLVGLTHGLSAAELAAAAVAPDEEATVEFEIRHLRRAVGAMLPILLRFLEIERLQSRRDIDALAAKLLSFGL